MFRLDDKLLTKLNRLGKLERKDFLNYQSLHYNPSNIIFVVAGNENHFNWTKEIENYLKNYPFKNNSNYQKVEIKQNKQKVLLDYKKTDQAHLTIGFPAFKRTDKRRPIMKVLNNILGETMSSRLFTQVRERRGLAYYISTDYWDFQDNGAIIASAGVDINRVDLAIKVILEEFQKIKMEKISDWELSNPKRI